MIAAQEQQKKITAPIPFSGIFHCIKHFWSVRSQVQLLIRIGPDFQQAREEG